MTKKSEKRSRYSLESKPLGKGGEAEVYPATDKVTKGHVAFKRLLSKNEHSIARMRREIAVQAAIDHPNVMPLLDASDNAHWYVMPIAIAVLDNCSRPLASPEVAQIVRDCLAGLGAAHDLGYIHRDITPRNVLRLADATLGARWVLADWGLVRRTLLDSVNRTAKGQAFGTAPFAAPEMWEDAHEADRRTDYYSIGRVAAWALTTAKLKPNVPISVPDAWVPFVSASTHHEPERRPASVHEMLSLVPR